MGRTTEGTAWERWEEVDRLFTAALERPEAERLPWVARACAGDWTLYEAVLSLLRAAEQSEGMFETPDGMAVEAALSRLAEGRSADLPSGTHIGAFRIVRPIGRGGMGTVFLAERDGADFDQQVAIKVLRRGIDTDDVVRRFVVERRILASLTHPNIARLFDGGATSDGRPYLVMEHIEGTPITRYCDAHALPLRRRLRLFLDVADAVRHAHANLVVHRDLKPSNILVTQDGSVKLLDFGIAKLIDSADDGDGALTRTGTHMFTPDYASPEQARGETVTTASDVYQLGILLFQLITGHRPQDRSGTARRTGTDAFERTEVLRPSTQIDHASARARSSTRERLRRLVRGDLDHIVQMALRADPERRYASAEQLAGDVRNWLNGRPVSARPDTRAYRLRKFIGRNPWLLPAAAAAIVFATLYVVTLRRHAAALELERNEARAQAERAEEVQSFLVGMFRSADPYTPADPERGRRITVVEALDVGTERLRQDLEDRPRIRAALLDAIAGVYQSLGAVERAVPLREETLALQLELLGETAPEVLESLGQLGRMLHETDRPDTARSVLERRLALTLRTGRANPRIAEARIGLAQLFVGRGMPEEASAQADSLLAFPDSLTDTQLSEAWRIRSTTAWHPDSAVVAARRSLDVAREAYPPRSPGIAFAHVQLASALSTARRIDEARQEFDAALPILVERLGEEHPLTLNTLNNVAVLLRNAGDHAGALAAHRRVLDARRNVHGEDHWLVAASWQNLGTSLASLERYDEAIAAHRRAAAIYQSAPDSGSYLPALPFLSMAATELRRNRPAEAEQHARRAIARLDGVLPDDSLIPAIARCRLGQARIARGDVASGARLLAGAAAVLEPATSLPEYRAECLEALADAHARSGRADSAAVWRARAG